MLQPDDGFSIVVLRIRCVENQDRRIMGLERDLYQIVLITI